MWEQEEPNFITIETAVSSTYGQALLIAFLAYPADELARKEYFEALVRFGEGNNVSELTSRDKGIILRSRRRVLFARCGAANIARCAFSALAYNQCPPTQEGAALKTRNELRRAFKREALFKNAQQLWKTVWLDSLFVLPLALTVRDYLVSAKLGPEELVFSGDWFLDAIRDTELSFFRLVNHPIYSFDPTRVLRFKSKKFDPDGVQVKCGEHILSFFDPPPVLPKLDWQPVPDVAQKREKRDPSPKLYSRREPYFVKVVRGLDEKPAFDWNYGYKAFQNKVAPAVVPDANVLSRMLEFMQVFSEWDEINGSGLDELFAKLKLGPTAYFCPSMAYRECGRRAFAPTKRAVDLLIEKFVPGLDDEDRPNFDKKPEDFEAGRTPYRELGAGMRALTSVAYLTFLRTVLFKRQCHYLQPKEIFFVLLNYLSVHPNSIQALPVEAAKHYLFDRSGQGDLGKFGVHSKNVKKNFFKGGGKPERIKANCLNAARDVAYTLVVANYIAYDQDFWLVTFDKGISSLFELVHLMPAKQGTASNKFRIVSFDARSSHAYWQSVDQLQGYFCEKREESGGVSFDQAVIDRCVLETEAEISKVFS